MPLLPHQFKAFKSFFETLRTELSSLRETIQKIPPAISDKHVAEQQSQAEDREGIERAINELTKGENKADGAAETGQQERHEQILTAQYVIAAVTFLAFVAAAIYAWEAHRQLRTMNQTLQEVQKQTNLIRQQLIGTQAAVIVIGDTPKWDNQTQELTFQITNAGQLIGKLNQFDAIIQRKSLPSQTAIGEPIKVHTENQEITKNGTVNVPTILPWLLPELKDTDPWPGGEFVTIDGSYSYDNGFGDSINQKFCFEWISPWNLSFPDPSKRGGRSGGGWAWGTGNQPCRTVKEMETEFFAFKRYIKEASAPHE